MVNPDIKAVYAHAVAKAAQVRDARVEAAFAKVTRERFLGPPPWHVLDDFVGTRPTSDPADLYRDVLVAIDRTRGINNGEPQLWAFVFDRLQVRAGDRILHVGAGTGYYTAILAELTGPSGSVVAMELEADLAERARASLIDYPHVQVRSGDAAALTDLPYDRIVFSCGITGLAAAWLDRLGQDRKMAAPFTGSSGAGVFLLLAPAGQAVEVTPLSGVIIYPAAGFRTPDEERLIDGITRADPQALWRVRSLRKLAETAPGERIYGFSGYAMTARAP